MAVMCHTDMGSNSKLSLKINNKNTHLSFGDQVNNNSISRQKIGYDTHVFRFVIEKYMTWIN
jgi:hypothetical protein